MNLQTAAAVSTKSGTSNLRYAAPQHISAELRPVLATIQLEMQIKFYD